MGLKEANGDGHPSHTVIHKTDGYVWGQLLKYFMAL